MHETRKLALALAAAVVAIVLVAAIEWNVVSTAQSRLSAEVATTYSSVASLPLRVLANPDSLSAGQPLVTLGGLPTRQAELGVARNATTLLMTLTIFAGCFAVAFYSESIWPSAAIGIFGWLASGLVAAALASYSLQLVGTLSKSVTGAPVTWTQPTGGLPFSLYVLLGLTTAFFLQGLIPWALGWFLGSRIRSWRRFAVDFATKPGLGENLPSNRRRCACGAINLANAQQCYACGTSFVRDEVVEVANLEAPASWRAREWSQF